MSTVTLILAAGEQARWEMDRYPFYKQLLDVGGETIIARIWRQCRARGAEPCVITHSPELVQILSFKPERHRWTVETLLATHELWQERTIVLLGDVVYSQAVMDRIFAPQEQELKVFGNEYEIYALSMRFQSNLVIAPVLFWIGNIKRALNYAIEHAESGTPGGGKLRKFYQLYCGLDPDSDEIENEVLDRVSLQDYTRDVDTRKDYIQLQNKVVKAGRLDDLGEKE